MADRDVEKGDVDAEQERNSPGLRRRGSPPNRDNRASEMTAVHGNNEANGNTSSHDEKRMSQAGPHREDDEDRTGKEPEDDGMHSIYEQFSVLTNYTDFHGEDEYTALLHFIDNAAKMKPKDEDEDEDEETERKRVRIYNHTLVLSII